MCVSGPRCNGCVLIEGEDVCDSQIGRHVMHCSVHLLPVCQVVLAHAHTRSTCGVTCIWLGLSSPPEGQL